MVDLFGDPIEKEEPQAETASKTAPVIDKTKDDIDKSSDLSPRQNDRFYGHEKNLHDLSSRAKDKNLPHAMIFQGPSGVGKATIAYRLIRSLFSNEQTNETLNVSKSDPFFQKIAQLSHPDLLVVERSFDEKKGMYKNSVSIDQVRKIAPFMQLRPSTKDGWRVVLLEDAHTLTGPAQNGLLKILEEPPERAILILLTDTLGKILPTIRSRCQSYAFSSLNRDDFKSAVTHAFSDFSAEIDETSLYDLSQGSPGKAKELIEEGALLSLRELIETFNAWPNIPANTVNQFADKTSQNQNGQDMYPIFSKNILWILNSIIKAQALKKTAHDLPKPLPESKGICELMKKTSPKKLLEIMSEIQIVLEKTSRQALDKKNSILQVFFFLQEQK